MICAQHNSHIAAQSFYKNILFCGLFPSHFYFTGFLIFTVNKTQNVLSGMGGLTCLSHWKAFNMKCQSRECYSSLTVFEKTAEEVTK